MNKFLFLDLDETLIHAEYNVFRENCTRVVFNVDTGGWGDAYPESYGVLLRPDALKFLKTLHLLYPNVYMLTAAISDYGLKMNDAFKLGFSDHQIIGRDMWHKSYLKTPNVYRFTEQPCCSVLVDNQHPKMRNARDKIEYLEKFGTASYVKVTNFFGNERDKFTDNMMNDIVNSIDERFKLMQP